MTAADRGSRRGSMLTRRRRRSPRSSRMRHTGGASPRHHGAVIRSRGRQALPGRRAGTREYATTTQVDPHAYVGQYESVALALRVIPYGDGIAFRVAQDAPIRDRHARRVAA